MRAIKVPLDGTQVKISGSIVFATPRPIFTLLNKGKKKQNHSGFHEEGL